MKDNKAEVISTDTDSKSSWGGLGDDIGFFVSDFFKNRLTAEEKLIFFSYYITGMTLEELSDRLYSKREVERFDSEEICDEDDIDLKHISIEGINIKLKKINEHMRNQWKYVDSWR